MAVSRTLSPRFNWTEEDRAIELLDWREKPEDFNRLCEHVLELLVTRTRTTRERVFERLPEGGFRNEVRVGAERFQEEFIGLPMFIYMRLRFQILPERKRRKNEPSK